MSILGNMLGSVVNTIGGIIGGVANRSLDQQAINQQNQYNRIMRDEERVYDKKMLDESRAYDREIYRQDYEQNRRDFLENRSYEYDMWQKQNQYNSPEEQMKRLKAAGLNPMLVYGHGVTQSAGSIPAGSAPQSMQGGQKAPLKSDQLRSDRTRGQIDLGNMAENYYRIRAMDEQLENLRANREDVEARTKLVNVQVEMARRDLDIIKETDKLPVRLRSSDPWQAQAVARGLASGVSLLGQHNGIIKGAIGDRTIDKLTLPGIMRGGWKALINYLKGKEE